MPPYLSPNNCRRFNGGSVVECEFPKSVLLIKWQDARLLRRVFGNDSSMWNDDGTPPYRADPKQRATFAAQTFQEEIQSLNLDALPQPE